MSLYFISDLHLRSAKETVAKYLVQFLNEIPAPKDQLVLGGDIFDLFVGNKMAFTEKFWPVLKAIKSASERGIEIYYAEGNHDFHLAGIFGVSNVKIVPDAFSLLCQGKKIWVAHGDRIDPDDKGYHLLRYTTRSRLVKRMIKALPNRVVDSIGKWSSKQSRKYNSVERMDSKRAARTKDLFRQYALERMAEGYEIIFLGHSHLKDELKQDSATYINLGYSDAELLYAEANLETGKIKTHSYKG